MNVLPFAMIQEEEFSSTTSEGAEHLPVLYLSVAGMARLLQGLYPTGAAPPLKCLSSSLSPAGASMLLLTFPVPRLYDVMGLARYLGTPIIAIFVHLLPIHFGISTFANKTLLGRPLFHQFPIDNFPRWTRSGR